VHTCNLAWRPGRPAFCCWRRTAHGSPDGLNAVTRSSTRVVALVVNQAPGLEISSLDTQAFFIGSISATFDDVLVGR
jgi:hypothetical protein